MLLFYFPHGFAGSKALLACCRQMGLSYRVVKDTQTTLTLNELFAGACPEKESRPLPHALLVMKDIEKSTLQQLTKRFEESDARMERKAMWTRHNQEWTLRRLADEIEQEHRYFQKQKELYALFAESNTLQESDYTADSWTRYARTLWTLYQKMQEEVSQSELDAMLEQARAVKKSLRPRAS